MIIVELFFLGFIFIILVLPTIMLIDGFLGIIFDSGIKDIYEKHIKPRFHHEAKNVSDMVGDITSNKQKKNIRIFEHKYYEIKAIKHDFNDEYKIATTLIEDLFPSPQLTNERYINEVDLVHDKFYEVYDKIVAFLESYPIEDKRSTTITEEAIANLNGLYYTLMRLTSELAVLSVETDDIDIEDVEDFVNNVHNYSKTGDKDETFDRFTKTR